MAPVKRHPHTRSQRRMKLRRRKPSIPQLVYKFLSVANEEGRENALHSCYAKCRYCKQHKLQREVLHSLHSWRTGVRNMANRHRRDGAKNPKSRNVKRHRRSRDQALSSCMHKCSGGEGLKKVKKYIQAALDFGVESGYLIPKDRAFSLLRVSSDLLNDGRYKHKVRMYERAVSQDRNRSPRTTPTRFEDYQVQEARRRRGRRRGRRRSRSRSRRGRRRSRRRGRGRSRSDNPEEAVENNDVYELNDDNEKKNTQPEDKDRNLSEGRKESRNGEETVVKRDDDDSDLSIDEDETDEDEEKKRDNPTKS